MSLLWVRVRPSCFGFMDVKAMTQGWLQLRKVQYATLRSGDGARAWRKSRGPKGPELM